MMYTVLSCVGGRQEDAQLRDRSADVTGQSSASAQGAQP